MMDVKPVVARNLAELRRAMGWTQTELAQKLNYSDKAVSKWERAESVPDVAVLKEVADLFGVTLDDLLRPNPKDSPRPAQAADRHRGRNRLIISLLSASLIYLIATVAFVVLACYPATAAWPLWKIYVYAAPAACVVLLVFNALWGKRPLNFVIISLLVWSALTAAYISFLPQNYWLIFLIGIPGQIIVLLWSGFKPWKK